MDTIMLIYKPINWLDQLLGNNSKKKPSADKFINWLDNLLGNNYKKKPAAATGCALHYDKDFPEKEPVLFGKRRKEIYLIEPYDDAVPIASKASIILACPGSGNRVAEVGNQTVSATCVTGQTLKVNGDNLKLAELGCTKTVTGEFQETCDACGGDRGVIKHIGYFVDGGWHTLFDVCYNDNNGEALYADHTLYGSAITYAKVVNKRPGFKVGGLGPGVPADVAYKQVTQKATFTVLLGSAALAEKYIHTNSYLARGHLAPDGDFVFVSSQFSTYFYINTVPQWQAINNGNWKSLEFALRASAASMKEDIRIITGGYQVLTYPNSAGKDTEMYLVTGKKLPIPKFVWKIFYVLGTGKAIAFVSINDPFKEVVAEDDYLCKNICKNYNWGTSAWDDPSRGLLYCCSVTELAKVIDTIPQLNVRGIQDGKNSLQYLKRDMVSA